MAHQDISKEEKSNNNWEQKESAEQSSPAPNKS